MNSLESLYCNKFTNICGMVVLEAKRSCKVKYVNTLLVVWKCVLFYGSRMTKAMWFVWIRLATFVTGLCFCTGLLQGPMVSGGGEAVFNRQSAAREGLHEQSWGAVDRRAHCRALYTTGKPKSAMTSGALSVLVNSTHLLAAIPFQIGKAD